MCAVTFESAVGINIILSFPQSFYTEVFEAYAYMPDL